MTNTDKIPHSNRRDMGVFLGGSHAPIISSSTPAPKTFWIAYIPTYSHSNRILHGDQTRWKDSFDTIDLVQVVQDLAKNSCDKNANARSACSSLLA